MRPSAIKEFKVNRAKMHHGLVISAVCAAAGLAALLSGGESLPERQWSGGLLLALGAGVALHAWYSVQRAGVQLRLDEDGIWFREWSLTVPWAAVEDVYQSGSRMQPYVTISLRDTEAFLAGLSGKDARRLRANRLWKAPELRIPFSAVEASRDEILDALRGGLREYG